MLSSSGLNSLRRHTGSGSDSELFNINSGESCGHGMTFCGLVGRGLYPDVLGYGPGSASWVWAVLIVQCDVNCCPRSGTESESVLESFVCALAGGAPCLKMVRVLSETDSIQISCSVLLTLGTWCSLGGVTGCTGPLSKSSSIMIRSSGMRPPISHCGVTAASFGYGSGWI